MKTRLRDLLIDRGAACIRLLERLISWGSRIGNSTFLTGEEFPWAKRLEAGVPKMQRELAVVLERPEDVPNFQDLSKDQIHLSDDDKWKTYFFYAFGHRAERNCDTCPETAKLVESVPGMQTAFFSILAPGKHIPAHRGAFKGIVRYHLALKVPAAKENCRIRVGTDYRHWEEGQSMFFDDTYFHEVWNDTDETRVVLFMDVVRPLRFPANLINAAVIGLIKHSPFVTDAVANYNAWEAKLDRYEGGSAPA
jgi:aspartyl/asparaginyl beta-hydroxylase (cupin superfamily)